MDLVFASAAANSVTASGLVPPTVDQTIGSPRSSARTIAASDSAGLRPRIARPARSAATVAHLHGVHERVLRIEACWRRVAASVGSSAEARGHAALDAPLMGISCAPPPFLVAGATSMHAVELTLGLLVAVAVLTTIARMIRVPDPILLVVGGIFLALSPAVPDVVLAPDLVFLLILPPLLYLAAFDTAIRDVRALLRPILSLAVGLVLATTIAVAVVVRAVMPEIGWPAAFALGAIVSPPDAVAAVAVMRRLSVPQRLVTLLEAESLFNDASALIA